MGLRVGFENTRRDSESLMYRGREFQSLGAPLEMALSKILQFSKNLAVERWLAEVDLRD